MNGCKGFTLIELFTVMAITAILAAIGLPSFSAYLAKAESKTTISQLRQMAALSRESATRLRRVVTFCGIDETGECVKTNFTQLVSFIDLDNNKTLDDADEILLLNDIKIDAELTLKATYGRSYIRFKYNGSAQQAGSFIYCDAQYPQASGRITTSLSGRTYIGRDRDGDGRVELTSGDPITC